MWQSVPVAQLDRAHASGAWCAGSNPVRDANSDMRFILAAGYLLRAVELKGNSVKKTF